MQSRRVKVGSVRPDERVNFSVNFDLVKKRQITQRPVQLPSHNWLEIYDLLSFIIEHHAQNIRCNNLEAFHSVDGMSHRSKPYLL